MKFARLNSCIQSFAEVDNENLLKVKLSIQHDGANKNGTKFSLDNIKKAEKSLRNIPILAYIKRDENGEAQDFDQHNMIQRVVETDDGYDLVTTYLEKPIGVIPTETEITYEEMDGRTYLCATGYIWKRYANEGFDILMQSDQKGTSMEIEIYEGRKDKLDGLYDITDYSFLGVTCLGDDVESGMYDTTITKYAASKSYKKELADIYKEIFTLENGKEDTMTEEVKEVVEAVEETVVEEVVVEEATIEEVAVEEVIEEPIANEETTEEATEEVVVEEPVEEVIVEEVTYQEEVQEAETTEEVQVTEEVVEPVEDKEVVEEAIIEQPSVEELVEKLGTKEVELNSLMEKICSLEDELNSLREYKVVKEKEELVAKVDTIAEKFTTLNKEEIEVVKTKVLNEGMTTEEFEKELYYLVGIKTLENKSTYAATEPMGAAVRMIPVEDKKEITDEYGGLLKKYNLI